MNEEIKDKSYYAVIPAVVRYDKDLMPNAKLLYGEITALSNERGYCWANNTYFAELYNTSKRSISKWIGQLTQKGYIAVEIVYKDDTKCITERRLKPIEEKFYTLWKKSSIPYGNKVPSPMEEKFQDNNTINIKSNITIYSPVITYLNEKCKTSYRATTSKTKTLINARVNEGFVLEDFKKVIDTKSTEWLNTDMAKYLRPETLFGPKFESYLNQERSKVIGKYGNNIQFKVPERVKEDSGTEDLNQRIKELGII